MVNYRSETIVTPSIPTGDMNPLERLLLSLIFSEEEWSDGVDFYSWVGPREVVSPLPNELRSAWEASQACNGLSNPRIAEVLAQFEALKDEERPLTIDIDISSLEGGWPGILQDVVRRSTSLDEVVIHIAQTCSHLVPDGFGGEVTRITADRIQFGSTAGLLATMRALAPSTSNCMGEEDTRVFIETVAQACGSDGATMLT